MKYQIIVKGELIAESECQEEMEKKYAEIVERSKHILHIWHKETIYFHIDGMPYKSRIRGI